MITFSAACLYLLIGYGVLGRIEGPNSGFIWSNPPRMLDRLAVIVLWPIIAVCLMSSGRF